MHAQAEQLSPAKLTERRLAPEAIGVAATILLAASVVAYLRHALSLAGSAPLWMDEVLAVWTARQPSLAAVWQALKQGSEFSPPAYDALLHALTATGFTSPLAMRMPSILAGMAAAGAVFALVRRHASIAVAALAAATVLEGCLFAYAVQARPYACVVAAIAWAVVLWDGYPRYARPDRLRLSGILFLCSLAVALHFYAVLLVGLLALGELLRTFVKREVRWLLLGALALATLSILLWWPIARAATTWNAQDVFASDFYARPKLASLLHAYLKIVFPLSPALLIVGVMSLVRLRADRARGERRPRSGLGGIALLACMAPIAVFLFAVLVTHAFNERYVVAAALGVSLVLAIAVRRLGPIADATALVLLGLIYFLVPAGGEIARPNRLASLALARSAPRGLPLVTGDGFRFFEISENERTTGGARLIYLRVPDPPDGGDPTNRHQVERWAAIDPTMRVADAATFLCLVPTFLLLRDATGGHDDLPAWLRGRAELDWFGSGDAALALVHARRCPPKRIEAER